MDTIFSGLITSKMRIKIIMRLFHNPDIQAYLRELAAEFNASPSHIKNELDQLEKANLLTKTKSGKQMMFSANKKHPIFRELQSMVSKALGMDKILESIIGRLGNLELAFLIGDYAKGKDTGIVDLVLIGDIDQENLHDLKVKTEHYIERKIRTLVLSIEEYSALKNRLDKEPIFLLWENT